MRPLLNSHHLGSSLSAMRKRTCMITNTPSGATNIVMAGIHVIDITTMTDASIVVGTDK